MMTQEMTRPFTKGLLTYEQYEIEARVSAYECVNCHVISVYVFYLQVTLIRCSHCQTPPSLDEFMQ